MRNGVCCFERQGHGVFASVCCPSHQGLHRYPTALKALRRGGGYRQALRHRFNSSVEPKRHRLSHKLWELW